ncbi:MAG: gamma carbonic anhydrase family protein [Deltaproteobacteria bacterium]|nr:gamma carbonic anhydrase family protein [Deltaproteobacteria bacterium]
MLGSSSKPIVGSFSKICPDLHERVWVAPGAVVVGDVRIDEDSSVWYGAVLRGDVNQIRIGARSNIQDNCVIHVSRDLFSTSLGNEVTVGHGAVIHGSKVRDGALIGIGSVVLDGSEIGESAWVAAGSLVTPGTCVEPRTLVAGCPAREVRRLSSAEVDHQRELTLKYVSTAREHARSIAFDLDPANRTE